jgi:hypothetical protein
VFDKTKTKVDTLIKDRVTAPISTSIGMSIAAVIIAVLALAIVVRHADH